MIATLLRLPRRIRARLGALTLAFAMASVAGGALAHELDHQFHKHDLPCALHVYAGHLNGIPPSGMTLPVAMTGFDASVVPATSAPVVRPLRPYSVRAPPAFSLH